MTVHRYCFPHSTGRTGGDGGAACFAFGLTGSDDVCRDPWRVYGVAAELGLKSRQPVADPQEFDLGYILLAKLGLGASVVAEDVRCLIC